MNGLKNYWYIIAESRELKNKQILSKTILGNKLVIWRNNNQIFIHEDRCLHRDSPLSKGSINELGQLVCPYHGWVCEKSQYMVEESQGYIYVCLNKPMRNIHEYPYYKKHGWNNLRLVNEFKSRLIDCVENFINVPHTAFVHRGIFRKPKQQKIKAKITTHNGLVEINYFDETDNLGLFAKFLNCSGKEIFHVDKFFPSNITEVTYKFNDHWQYIITSQSVPVSENKTIVYTDISYNFGIFTYTALPIVHLLAQKVIDQDLEMLNAQADNIKYFGEAYYKRGRKLSEDLVYDILLDIHEAIVHNQDLNDLPKIEEVQEMIV